MYSQQPFPAFAHGAGLIQDGNHQFNIATYPGIPGQTFFPFAPMKSEYGELGSQSTGESSSQVIQWNTLPSLDHGNQTDNQSAGQLVRGIISNSGDNRRYIKRALDAEVKTESPESKYTPPSNLPSGPYYSHPWNTFWPGIATSGNPTSSNPLPSQTFPGFVTVSGTPQNYQGTSNQSPNSSCESGISSLDNSRCSSTNSSSSSTQGNEPFTGPNNVPNERCSGTPSSITGIPTVDGAVSNESDEDVESNGEMELFAKELKHKRITLGFTQADVGYALGVLYGKTFSQTTICRFESLQLSMKNMCKLKPLLNDWLHEVETNADLQEVLSRGHVLPQAQKRKHRTSIENHVRRKLESYFMQCSKPSAQEMTQLARELNMDKDVIRVWFCNRRQKGKREVHPYLKDNMVESFEVVQSQNPHNAGCFSVQPIVTSQGYTATPVGTISPIYTSSFHKNEYVSQVMSHGMSMENVTS
ncbi:POU domain, class 5, transcription factor 1.2-like [Bombina bombina]|uniref:POU domain, class 5, transcription factor 1.2-like n=1 Tax=Bombina bombina TaxID=8345 RepID=UPI00235AC2FB|nr:POU domain, class 5, transcription factor 1.2-like [Bombina bombina]